MPVVQFDRLKSGAVQHDLRPASQYWLSKLAAAKQVIFKRGSHRKAAESLQCRILEIKEIQAAESEAFQGPVHGSELYKSLFKTAKKLLAVKVFRLGSGVEGVDLRARFDVVKRHQEQDRGRG